MQQTKKHHSGVDKLILKFDHALKRVAQPNTAATTLVATRPSPAEDEPESTLSEQEKKHIGGLMRINHTGEVCAQALYKGQATTAKTSDVQEQMQHAALEEIDHLAWCEERLKELQVKPSRLNHAWYGLSYSLGALAGFAGDRWSLGFVAETEKQVCRHLDKHMEQIPNKDRKTRKIIAQMKVDEAEHATVAEQAGGYPLPIIMRAAMRIMSKVMTTITYRF